MVEQLRWSPTALELAYVDQRGLNLWSDARTATLPGGWGVQVSWAADGRHVAYEALDGFNWTAVVVDAASPRELLRIPGGNSTLNAFAWNPRGSRLLAMTRSGALQTAGADGSRLTTIATHVNGSVWLGEGDHVAYATDGHVSVASANGSNATIVWSGAGDVRFLRP